MSQLIDPGLFKAEEGDTGERPFASPYAAALPSGVGFKDPQRLTTVLVGLLGLDTLLNGVFVAWLAVGLTSPQIAYGEEAAVTTIGVLGTAISLIWFVRLVVMLMWFYRANKNARSVSSGLEITPGWAAGFFFVPIMSLFKPYQAISEIWRSATNPFSWRGLSDPPIIRWWWGLYLVSAFLPVFIRLMDGAGQTPLTLVSLAAGMVENVCFFFVIRYVAHRQWEQRNESVFD